MQVQLTSISPVAYSFTKEGDTLSIRRIAPRKNEYREKIGAAQEALLVFKGVTKIGMIPHAFIEEKGKASFGRLCRVTKIEQGDGVIIIEIKERPNLAESQSPS